MNTEQNRSVQVHEGGGPTKELLVSQHVDMLMQIYPELFKPEERDATALWVEQSIDRLIKHQEDCIRTRAYDEADKLNEEDLVDCSRCKGTGKTTSGMAGFECEVCNGTGKTLPTHSEEVKKAIAENAKAAPLTGDRVCPHCKGVGGRKDPCFLCQGTGRVGGL